MDARNFILHMLFGSPRELHASNVRGGCRLNSKRFPEWIYSRFADKLSFAPAVMDPRPSPKSVACRESIEQ